jgi:hypothetical protein
MSKKYCSKCGNQIVPGRNACPYCGTIGPALQISTGGGIGFEWRSKAEFYGYPLVHIAFGKDANGKRRIAKGVIAIGQFAIGMISIAQVGIGFLFGFGQVMIGLTAISQVAITLLFGIGQLATGYVAIGQLVLGYYGLCQIGFARYLWMPDHADAQAVHFFNQLWHEVTKVLPFLKEIFRF